MNILIPASKQDWYDTLLVDLRKLEFAGIVVTKHAIGKRIIKDELKFGSPEYGSKRVENIAKDLRTTTRDIWLCIQFAKKCDNITQLEGKSWYYITHSYLPTPRVKDRPALELPEGKYNIIYADPPWGYYEGGYKNQSQHYGTMTIEELKDMPLDDLAADNCVLFLWATFPILNEVFDLVKWWGFEYSTVGFVWVKKNKNGSNFFGLGSWTRANAELCLIATKGTVERKDASISQIIESQVEGHSKKPGIVRDKIVQLVGDLPRIELFARQKAEGWEAWGDQSDQAN